MMEWPSGTASASDMVAVSALEVDQEIDPHTIRETTNAVAPMSNGYVGQLGVHGGYVYMQAGTGATLPTAAFQSFFYSAHVSGFIGFAFDLLGFALGGALERIVAIFATHVLTQVWR